MKDYYSLFVELSLQQCTKIDYADELKVTILKMAMYLIQDMKYVIMRMIALVSSAKILHSSSIKTVFKSL